MRRKGQFFVIGAIVVVISLFTLTEALIRNPSFDPSIMQGQDVSQVYLHIVDSIEQTIVDSDDSNRDNNIQHLIAFLNEELADDQYRLALDYPVPTSSHMTVQINLTSPNFRLGKFEELG